MYLIITILLSIIISFAASLTVYFQPKGDAYLKLFTPFLLVTLLVESASNLGLVRGKDNSTMYNFFSVLEFSFYFFILGEIVKGGFAKKCVRAIIWIYGAVSLGNIIFIQKLSGFPSLTYALGCLLIVAICIYYFFELFQISQSVPLVRQPAFWICSGLLFFYCCSFPIFGPMNFIAVLPPVIRQNLVAIIDIMNVLLYSSFTIAFLCRLRTRKSMS
ncbi:MAG TPA: hypothetical protein VGM30_00245 [Puia sp.]|jgi:hypothetical protein